MSLLLFLQLFRFTSERECTDQTGIVSSNFAQESRFLSDAYSLRYLQWRTEGGFGVFNSPPHPKFRSFDKVEPDCKLSGKCLVFLFQHPN